MNLIERMTEVFPYALIASAIVVVGIMMAARIAAHVKLVRIVKRQIAERRCVACKKMCDVRCAYLQRQREKDCTEFIVKEEYEELARSKWWQCFIR